MTTSKAPLSPEALERQRAYHREYFQKNPDAARRNLERTTERNRKAQEESRANAEFNRMPWDASDERDLIDLYETHTQKEIAFILGRTIRSVQKKAKELGLRKNVRRVKGTGKA